MGKLARFEGRSCIVVLGLSELQASFTRLRRFSELAHCLEESTSMREDR